MSLGITDHIVVIIAVLFFWRGWHTGLLQTLLFPLSFIICAVAAAIFFDLTKNFIPAMFICVLGTIVLSFIVSTMFSLWRTSIDKNYRNYVFWTSRLAGGTFSLFWLCGLSFIAVLLFTMVDWNSQLLNKARDDIINSGSYNWAFLNILNRNPIGINTYTALSVLKNPDKLEEVSQTEEFTTFFLDPKIQKIMSDRTFLKGIADKNILSVLFHPQLGSIYSDRQLMKKLVVLGTRIYEDAKVR